MGAVRHGHQHRQPAAAAHAAMTTDKVRLRITQGGGLSGDFRGGAVPAEMMK